MKVLILSVTAGYGHIVAARAVSESLQEKGAEVRIVDVYQFISRTVQKTIDRGYLLASKRTPELYRVCYSLAVNHRPHFLNTPRFSIIHLINTLGISKFSRLIEEFQPDAILCTHVFAAQLMNEMKGRGEVSVPVIGIVTDYTIHPFWEDVQRIDYIVTASELLTHQAVKRGIDPSRLLPFGIPAHPKFSRSLSRESAARLLGIRPDRPTVLLMGGSMGYADGRKIILQLTKTSLPLQILAVCGRNRRQLRELTQLKTKLDGHCQLYPTGFAEHIEVMMSASDCLITKPGGLTVSEALAERLPMLLISPIPGHEERNAEFLVNNGAASRITKTFPADEAVVQLFENPSRLKTMKEMMQTVRRPEAAEKLADFLLRLSDRRSC